MNFTPTKQVLNLVLDPRVCFERTIFYVAYVKAAYRRLPYLQHLKVSTNIIKNVYIVHSKNKSYDM